MSNFVDPYKGLPDESVSRINADVPTDEYKLLQRIRTERGTVQTTINILFSKLIYELKRRGITDYTREDDFEQFVAECAIVGPGGQTPGPCAETNISDVRRRNPRTRSKDTTT